VVLGFELRVSCLLGRCSPLEPLHQPVVSYFWFSARCHRWKVVKMVQFTFPSGKLLSWVFTILGYLSPVRAALFLVHPHIEGIGPSDPNPKPRVFSHGFSSLADFNLQFFCPALWVLSASLFSFWSCGHLLLEVSSHFIRPPPNTPRCLVYFYGLLPSCRSWLLILPSIGSFLILSNKRFYVLCFVLLQQNTWDWVR
jgi:hypothetical protein